jgi:AraC-like DNA-binding protein
MSSTAADSSPARSLRVVQGIDGLDQLREIVCGSTLHFEQLRRGELRSRFVRATLGTVTFDSAKYSLPVRAVGSGSENTVSFVLVRSEVVFNGERLRRGDVVLYPAGAGFEGFAKSSFSDYVFTLRPDDLALFADAAGADADFDWLKTFAKLPRNRAATMPLAQIAAGLDRGTLRATAELSTQIMACLCGLLATKSRPRSDSAPLARQIRLIRCAETLLTTCREEPQTLDAISGEMGASVRKLQMAFAAVTGLGPNEYGRILRLHMVRRELLRLGPRVTVTDVALRHSFSHLGRFSVYYREFFGETPSETLRRAPGGTAL